MAVNMLQKQHGRGPGRPFQKGQSGNPAGRPMGSRNRATQLADYGPDEHRLIKRCQVMADRIFDPAWVRAALAA